MPSYSIKDVMGLYSRLQDIARMNPDEGDMRSGSPPYKITPEDINVNLQKQRDLGDSGSLKIDGVELKPFEIVELYRQLCVFDKKDGRFDGKMNYPMFGERVTLPLVAKGHHFWGDEWTPINRLMTFITANASTVSTMMQEVDRDFKVAKGFTMASIDRTRTRTRPLMFNVEDDADLSTYSESQYIEDIARELDARGFEGYASLIDEARGYMAVLEVYIVPELRMSPEMEAKDFGYTHLFNLGNESAIKIMTYPQLGESEIYMTRRPAALTTLDGIEVERFVHLVGEDSRAKIFEEFLKPYYQGRPIADTSEERLSERWKKISHYLRRARVYNYTRYDHEITPALFKKMLILHESLHYRNSHVPEVVGALRDAKTYVEKIIHVARHMADPYERNHALGAILVELQAISLEASLQVYIKLDSLCKDMAKRDLNPADDPECRRLLEEYRCLEQLRVLAEDAEERLVEDEVYSVFFKADDLQEFDRAFDEERLVLNPNARELIENE